MPHIGRLDDQTLFSMGYNGAGVAVSSLMGRYLAAFVRGEQPDVGLLDAAASRSFHFIRCVNRPSEWWPAGTSFWTRSGNSKTSPVITGGNGTW